MSTRACIARPTPEGFSGSYHHWDGYPTGLGRSLYKLANDGTFESLSEMMETLIDKHPGGWSTINGRDWSVEPGYGGSGPECYCHGERSEEGWVVTQANASGSGCEFAYVINEEDGTMKILSSYWPEDGSPAAGQKMIGMFGMGNEDASWREFAVVELKGREPDWERLDQMGWGE